MSFSSKYAVVKLPTVSPAPPKLTLEQRLRRKMGNTIEVQSKILEAELYGTEYEPPSTAGKTSKLRRFWTKTAQGIAFTPLFENAFIFQKGEGVILDSLTVLPDLLMDFGEAVQTGEFDARIVEIFNNHKAARGAKSRGPIIEQPPGLADGDPSLATA